MKNKYFLTVALVLFLSTLSSFCFAMELEVSYPQLPGGEIITSTTPLTGYLRYLYHFGILIGVLAAFISLIIGGFLYITAVVDPAKRNEAKNRIFAGIFGLVLLLFTYLIITTINPQLQFFTTQKLKETPGVYLVGSGGEKRYIARGVGDVNSIKPPKSTINFTEIEYKCVFSGDPSIVVKFYNKPRQEDFYKEVDVDCNTKISIEGKSFIYYFRQAGVYFYNKGNCQGESSIPAINSLPNLRELNDKINSVKIIHNWPKNIAYIAILYDLVNYEGKCYYINPNKPCDDLGSPPAPSFDATASSVSIYRYDFEPEANPENKGVIFYRKSNFNEEGGWKKIDNSQIKGIYVGSLKNLKFGNVPKEEQNCIKWDFANGRPENNYCTKWEPPNLVGENLSSIKIDGNYFVILIYYDSSTDEWSSCQAFSTVDDINKKGPRQIKWEYINRMGKYPNYVLIFPVVKK